MEFHANGLLSTLVISLVAAFAGGLAVRIVNLPPMLGYLLAGIMLGPAMPGFTADQAMAADLAEVGVALLLFNVGLHFSLKDLLAVRRIAIGGASLQMIVSGVLGRRRNRYLELISEEVDVRRLGRGRGQLVVVVRLPDPAIYDPVLPCQRPLARRVDD